MSVCDPRRTVGWAGPSAGAPIRSVLSTQYSVLGTRWWAGAALVPPYNARFLLLMLAMAIVLAGCGRREVLGRITGKVTFQGQPVSEGVILFRNKAKAIYMTAGLKPDGTYVVRRASGEGLPLETYEVMIQPPLQDAPMGPALEPPKIKPYPNIPQKYRSYETSGLTVTVEEGENTLDVNME